MATRVKETGTAPEKTEAEAHEKYPKSRYLTGSPQEQKELAEGFVVAGNKPNHPGATLLTRNHQIIQQWAEARHATPATVPGTEHDGHLGVLRFNFPGYGGQKLAPASWDQWFKAFDARHLVFIYQETMRDGSQSNFFKFDSPEREHE